MKSSKTLSAGSEPRHLSTYPDIPKLPDQAAFLFAFDNIHQNSNFISNF
ncbi:hypothetical protein B4090_1532 [Bacillus licheniformis]|nr:hypothetical protein B4090_1532 [Bacillus licheniformis]TWK90630.1 hypothetical protein CHCC20327_2007 [Bacillus licheniformis]